MKEERSVRHAKRSKVKVMCHSWQQIQRLIEGQWEQFSLSCCLARFSTVFMKLLSWNFCHATASQQEGCSTWVMLTSLLRNQIIWRLPLLRTLLTKMIMSCHILFPSLHALSFSLHPRLVSKVTWKDLPKIDCHSHWVIGHFLSTCISWLLMITWCKGYCQSVVTLTAWFNCMIQLHHSTPLTRCWFHCLSCVSSRVSSRVTIFVINFGKAVIVSLLFVHSWQRSWVDFVLKELTT